MVLEDLIVLLAPKGIPIRTISVVIAPEVTEWKINFFSPSTIYFTTNPGRGNKEGNSPGRTLKTTVSSLPCVNFKARHEQAWVGLSGLPGAPETLGCILSPAEANEIKTAQCCIYSSCSKTPGEYVRWPPCSCPQPLHIVCWALPKLHLHPDLCWFRENTFTAFPQGYLWECLFHYTTHK